MSETKVKFSDVTEFTKFLVRFGSIYMVDEEGYIVNKGTDEYDPVLLKVGNQYKRLMVIKETITDSEALIINPLNENITESPEAKWLYKMMAVGLARRIIDIVRFTKVAIESSNNTDMHLSAAVMKFAARHKDLDDKVMEHFETVAKEKLNFVNVWYNRKMKESRFRCLLYDPDIRTEFPTLTKKALNVLISIVSDILTIDKDPQVAADQIVEKFSFKSDLITAPKLESILEVYLKLYTELNPYLDMCEMDDPDFVVDLTELGTHIRNIPAYYEKTKWFTGSVAEEGGKPSIRKLETIPSADRSAIPPNVHMPQTHRPAFVQPEPESNIPSNPMRRESYAPQMVPSGGGMFPQQQYICSPMMGGGMGSVPVGGGMQSPMGGMMYGGMPMGMGYNAPMPSMGGAIRVPVQTVPRGGGFHY